MSIYSKEFIDRTIRVWQPFSSSVLLDEEAREITDNIIGLSSLLSEWQKNDGEEREIKRKKNEGNKLLQTHEEVPSVPKMFGSAVPSGSRSRKESLFGERDNLQIGLREINTYCW